MALKKSELYFSLWSSCDELRGGMDASQYKDYVLVLLFIKYVSDKYAGQPYAAITVPKGASFKDMVALKGKPGIGDEINKKIIAPLAKANKLSDFPDFNDAAKLGSGKEMVDRLTNLIAIFENPALDFSKNRAEGDDILGDAYEYLMRHFATESGKSKGQFYTPAEVSRIMAQVIGIRGAKTSAATTVYDPTCGSGSLLLKVGDEAGTAVTLYGQEKDAATSGLARMNMILHDNPTALIVQGNTLADPKFKDGDSLKTFDYVVANPPFSDKRWSNGIDPLHDPYDRFQPFGTPPAKQGDYASSASNPSRCPTRPCGKPCLTRWSTETTRWPPRRRSGSTRTGCRSGIPRCCPRAGGWTIYCASTHRCHTTPMSPTPSSAPARSRPGGAASSASSRPAATPAPRNRSCGWRATTFGWSSPSRPNTSRP